MGGFGEMQEFLNCKSDGNSMFDLRSLIFFIFSRGF